MVIGCDASEALELRQRLWPDGIFVDFDHNICGPSAARDTALGRRKSESSSIPAHLYLSKQALCGVHKNCF
jgi:hypothetical protein